MATKALPPRASLEHLRKEAKSLLKAHEAADPRVCETLRLLPRLAGKSDDEVLRASLQLQECQHALACEYGFTSWADVKQYIESRDREEVEEQQKWEEVLPGQVRPESLVRFARRKLDLPEGVPYLGAGVARAITQILTHSGEETDFAEVTAASGWAFSFSYAYNDVHSAALAVGHFAFLPERLGYDRESVSCGDKDAAWRLVVRTVDDEQPLVCTLRDGGLVYGYRTNNGRREMWFDGAPVMGWTDIETPHPLDTCDTFTKRREPEPGEEIFRTALTRAVETAAPGVAALEAYLADVEDHGKDFARSGEWFCWGAFERLSARWCAARWLRRSADVVPDARENLLEAADRYDRAFQLYEQYRVEARCGVPTNLSLHERARTPERIAAIAPILREAIQTEAAGVEEMTKAVGALS